MADLTLELDRDDHDPEDAVTRGDLEAFGRQFGDAIIGELNRCDAERRRVEAERERFAPTATPNAGADSGGQDDGAVALRRLAQRAGVSEEQLAAALAAAKRAELEEIVQECLDERLPAALEQLIEDTADEDESSGRRQTRRGSGKSQRTSGASRNADRAAPAAQDSAPDEAPENLHWSQKPISRLFK
jgi:hypothetical protein